MNAYTREKIKKLVKSGIKPKVAYEMAKGRKKP